VKGSCILAIFLQAACEMSAGRLGKNRFREQPVPGFGASDSQACSHLSCARSKPDVAQLIRGMTLCVPR
jgi:hypothetical protein